MHGLEGEIRQRRKWHMWPVPGFGTVEACSSSGTFCKDGRRISVGDCALFQAPNSPPFIGIIRWLQSGKEDLPTLGVNWLYRPADVKLGKGISLEAAPNEIFYSFHKDEISGASLLHPCKVAFLRKGVELPSGISSFVCRRVYDIENKCLWWLTDQDYINERQEEVDQLLDKTRLEMHGAVHSGGRSPKPLNGPTPAQQLKPGSDSIPNSSTTSFPSQVKGKKREKGDQGTEPIKRERFSKTDDGDFGHFRSENVMKLDIAKIADKEGLVTSEAVEKLVNLMQLDRAEKKIDIAGRTMLADLIAATDNSEFLVRFLRGLPVLDDWLQEAHKGRTGDVSSPKENDKVIEELVLALLLALDKLPVNLLALKSCNIGKSVNHLRSHKNLEIQKKARSLVDTWKKRVDQEMKNNDAKSVSSQVVSWPGKQGFSDVSHGGNKHGGSSDIVKSSVTQSSLPKTVSGKVGHVDPVTKSISSPGSIKSFSPSSASMTINSKDSQCKTMVGSGGTSDLPLTTIKEEKSSSSSQSQNNSQSCSSDHAKTAGSAWKEDARSSTAGSMSAKTSGGSRHRKSGNGFLGSGICGVQKDSSTGKVSRNVPPSDKVSQSGLACEKSVDMPFGDHAVRERIIVRIPNPGRNTAQSISAGSFEDPAVVVSRASSPGLSDKQNHHDRKVKGKNEHSRANNVAADVNTESWQSNDMKDGLAGSDEGCDRSPTAVLGEEHLRNFDEIGKIPDIPKATSSSGNEKKVLLSESRPGKLHEMSFSSMNALIESCVAETTASLSVGDDLGMNLLASVAAGEMPKSDLVSPSSSSGRNSPVQEESFVSSDAKPGYSRENCAGQFIQPDDKADDDPEKRASSRARDISVSVSAQPSAFAIVHSDLEFHQGLQQICRERKNSLSSSLEHKFTCANSEKSLVSSVEFRQMSELCLKVDGKLDETVPDGCIGASSGLISKENSVIGTVEPESKSLDEAHVRRKACSSGENAYDVPDAKAKIKSPSSDESKLSDITCENILETSEFVQASSSDRCLVGHAIGSKEVEEDAIKESLPCPSLLPDSETKIVGEDLSGSASKEEERPGVATNHVDIVSNSCQDSAALPCSGNVLCPDVDKTKVERRAESSERKGTEPVEQKSNIPTVIEDRIGGSGFVVTDKSDNLKEEKTESSSISTPCEEGNNQEAEICAEFAGSKLSGAEADELDGFASSAEASCSTVATGSDPAMRMDFDLNEGFPVDEGNRSDPVTVASSLVNLPSGLLPFSVPSISNGLSASITVAAAAKGSFVPPEIPLKSEERWKGSAATSAFRPAEPRKVLDILLVNANVPFCETALGKQGRPHLDIDLNMPDERVLEDMACQSLFRGMGSEAGSISNCDLPKGDIYTSPAPSRATGGLDLDLNRLDEGMENGQFLMSTSKRLETSHLAARSSASIGFPNGEAHARDFDLNNGPVHDEIGIEPAQRNQHANSNLPFVPPVVGLRMNNTELGNLSPWFPPGNSYPAVTIPSFLPDRGDQPYPVVSHAGSQRILGSATGGTFGDLYRGSVLSSSPAMAFSTATAFPYAGFPFGTNFPLASTSFSGGSTAYMDSTSAGGACFPAVPSQLVGPAGAVLSPYGGPYPPNFTDNAGGASESSRKWGRQGLDLNAGPGSVDMEGRDERSPAATRQLTAANCQAFVEEQARIYQVTATGGMLKRKEPEGGWNAERFVYKQPSWQ